MILSFEFELRQIALFCGILPSEARSMINKMTKYLCTEHFGKIGVFVSLWI